MGGFLSPVDSQSEREDIAMNKLRFSIALLVLAVVTVIAPTAEYVFAEDPTSDPQTRAKTFAVGVPLVFEENQGQFAPGVSYAARTQGYALLFGKNGVTVSLSDSTKTKPLGIKGGLPSEKGALSSKKYSSLIFAFEGAQVTQPQGTKLVASQSNYFIGNDPSKWVSAVQNYSEISYASVYPGVDVKYYGAHGKIEYDFDVAAHADPSAIRMSVAGNKGLHVNQDGDLEVSTSDGSPFVLDAPIAYQTERGGNKPVRAAFVIYDKHTFGFGLGAYDRSSSLIIDPTLNYSTYLGGTFNDAATAVAADAAGNVYVTGFTQSLDFPLKHPEQGSCVGCTQFYDAFIAKYNPSGSLVYSTYLGGGTENAGTGITVDAAQNIYVTGYTDSIDFPMKNPVQGSCRGCSQFYDAFITKFDPTGSSLVYSTYLGGSTENGASGIALDSQNNVYVTGITDSSNFPLVHPFQSSCLACPDYMAFVTELNAAGTAWVYSTYLGGSRQNVSNSIAVDSSGNAYIAGYTVAPDFPVQNAYQSTCSSCSNSSFSDAFVAKFAAGGTLAYSTFLGGPLVDIATGIAVDASGNAYVTGFTNSTSFPTENPIYASCDGCVGPPTPSYDAFLTKLAPSGQTLVYSTFLGGSGSDFASSIVLDSAANVYIGGHTSSKNFPTVQATQASNGGGTDGFVTEVNSAGSALLFSTYLGGSGSDFIGGQYPVQVGQDPLTNKPANFLPGNGIAVNASGMVAVTGFTTSTNFPTHNSYQGAIASPNGNTDAFVTTFVTPSTAYALSVDIAGGQGTVTSNPSGINCTATCSGNFSANQQVTLTATAASGNSFIGWSGCDLIIGNQCTVTLKAPRTVTATFQPIIGLTYPLTINISGAGSVSFTGSSGNEAIAGTCTSSCTVYFQADPVGLTATPASEYAFSSWSGAGCVTTNCTIQFSGPATVTATFSLIPTQRIHQLVYGGPFAGWTDQDLTALASGALAPLGTGISSFAINDGDHVYYEGTDRHIHQLYYNNLSWGDQDLTAWTGGPQAAISAAVSGFAIGGTQHIYYVSTDQHVHQLCYCGGPWADQDLTASAGGTSPNAFSRLASFADSNGGQHVFYVGTDNHINHLSNTGGTWSNQDLTALTGGALTVGAGNLVAFADSGGGEHVYYIGGTDQHIYQLVICCGGGWGNQDLTAFTNGAVGQNGGGLTGFAIGGAQYVYYAGSNQHIYELTYGDGGNMTWVNNDLSAQTGATLSNQQSGMGSFAITDGRHVTYEGADAHVYQLYNNTQNWVSQDLTTFAGAPLALGGLALNSMFDANLNAQNTFYLVPGTIPAVSLTPTTLAFGNQTTGTTSGAQNVNLTNNSASSVSISSVGASGDFNEVDNCPSPLASGASCSISVTFTPTTTGTRTGTLMVSDSGSNIPQTASLTGTGIAPAPAVSLSPGSLTFSNQTVGTTSAAQGVTLSNSGTAPLSISSIAVSGDFTQTNNCGSSLAVGAQCGVNVTFTPSATGTRTGALTITDNASNSPQTASISGTGQSGIPGSGSVTINGMLQSTQVQTQPATQSTATISVYGAEQYTHPCIQWDDGDPPACTDWDPIQYVWDSGSANVYFNGDSYAYSGGFNAGSNAASVAQDLANSLNYSGSPVTVTNVATISQYQSNITIQSKAYGSAANYPLSYDGSYDTTDFSSASFTSSGDGQMSGGQDAAYGTLYDSGSCTITVNNRSDGQPWSGSGTTAAAIAASLANAINNDSSAFVNATASGNTILLTARTLGAATNVPFSSSCTWDSSHFSSASFTTVDSGPTLTGGSN